MKELKPCPFCGGEARIKTWRDRWGNWNAQVYCINAYGKSKEERCQADFFMRFATKEKVIEGITSKWNTRPNPWHTGTPTEEGLYLIAIPFLTDGIGKKIYRYETDYFNKAGKWRMFDNDVIAWQKIEPYKENEDGRTD